MTRLTAKRKPRKCPACGSGPVATILFGLPSFSEDLEKDLAENRVVLGGCIVGDDDPTWVCTACNVSIFKEAPNAPASG